MNARVLRGRSVCPPVLAATLIVALAACATAAPATSVVNENMVAPALRGELSSLQLQLTAAGWQARGPGAAGFLLAGSHATLPIQLGAGECVTIVARATRGARDVDAALYAAEGRLLALDSEPNPRPAIQACAVAAVSVYYVIQLYDGDGSFVAVPFFGSRATLAKAAAAIGGKPVYAEIVDAPEVAEDPVVAFSEGLRKRGFSAVGEPRRFAIAEGERVRENLPVETGQCYTVAAFGGAGISELSLRLLDEHGTELSLDAGHRAHVATQLCARTTATYALESVAAAGAGEVVLFVYRVDVMTAGGDAGLWLGTRPAVPVEPAAKAVR
jgi:hypothetical protein